MTDALTAIKQYVLNPDHAGSHLRKMSERMADEDLASARIGLASTRELRDWVLDGAADIIACYIHLVWDGAGPAEYAPRTLEILQQLQSRMRGMDPDCTWSYALDAFTTYIEQSNIARGTIDVPTDPVIVLRDRIGIQMALGDKNAETWAASGWQVADHIEARFGTAAGRREARRARGLWKVIARKRAAVRR